ncbi:metallophosphoesterase [Enterococcus sp. N342-3-1-2]
MKYLVVSDNHGDRQILVDLLDAYKDQVDLFLHCGDSELPDSDPLWDTYQVVCGNCDYGAQYPNQRTVETAVDRIYMTHGHLADVRFGITKLGLQAQQADAAIVLFGHTHQIACEKVGGRLFLNPGSISQPRGPINVKSFGIIESTAEAWHVDYYDRQFKAQEDLHFVFPR